MPTEDEDIRKKLEEAETREEKASRDFKKVSDEDLDAIEAEAEEVKKKVQKKREEKHGKTDTTDTVEESKSEEQKPTPEQQEEHRQEIERINLGDERTFRQALIVNLRILNVTMDKIAKKLDKVIQEV